VHRRQSVLFAVILSFGLGACSSTPTAHEASIRPLHLISQAEATQIATAHLNKTSWEIFGTPTLQVGENGTQVWNFDLIKAGSTVITSGINQRFLDIDAHSGAVLPDHNLYM
jgi:photosystem II stability/assembly factor-like uncharacterized protein